jgi:hypothetical protein
MTLKISGGCACGAVRYTSSSQPLAILNCHCRDCQRSSGTAFSSALAVPAESVVITGTPKWHTLTAASGATVRRAFCPECGAPLFADNSTQPEFMAIKIGSLDDPTEAKPMADIWTSSALPWAAMDTALPKLPKGPPAG